MGRRLTPQPEANLFAALPHFSLLSFVAIGVLASIAIIINLCASCYRKPTPVPSSSPPEGKSQPALDVSTTEAMVAPTTVSIETGDQSPKGGGDSVTVKEEDEKITELEAEIHGPIYGSAPAMSKSKRGLSMNLSIGLHEGLSRIRTSRKERYREDEDTLWKKTIIMGEKNRAWEEEGDQDQETGEQTAEATMGSWRRSYRPRSLSVSRTNSAASVGEVRQPLAS
ncbi:hypothetical protein HPP92_004870 [Vanilla planifolia]|uniref:Uncharacterized protein n=1 Tax=Vanilla planifolia TaxID=51239 RepID=A0A835VAT1_VANPL|nr:hypothetical protein HPP92_005225 [Vanilla planifolia]KAG0493876.1 hypothetical protein HPP92_004870 [Vanilla planifolia]